MAASQPTHPHTTQHPPTAAHLPSSPHLQALLPGGVVLQAQALAVLGVCAASRLHRRRHGAQPGVVAAIHQRSAHSVGVSMCAFACVSVCARVCVCV